MYLKLLALFTVVVLCCGFSCEPCDFFDTTAVVSYTVAGTQPFYRVGEEITIEATTPRRSESSDRPISLAGGMVVSEVFTRVPGEDNGFATDTLQPAADSVLLRNLSSDSLRLSPDEPASFRRPFFQLLDCQDGELCRARQTLRFERPGRYLIALRIGSLNRELAQVENQCFFSEEIVRFVGNVTTNDEERGRQFVVVEPSTGSILSRLPSFIPRDRTDQLYLFADVVE